MGALYTNMKSSKLQSSADTRPTICFPFTGDSVGGSHYSVLGLLKNIDRSRYRVMVVPQYADGEIAKLFQDHNIVIESGLKWNDYIPGEKLGLTKFLGNLHHIPAQIRFLRSNNVNIVHSNDGRTHATWAMAARLSGAKLLWHHRGDPTARGLNFAAPLLANTILTVSRFSLPQRSFWSGADKAKVVHSPFDTSIEVDRISARAALLKECKLPENSLIVGYSGIFIDRKRPLLFLDMIAKLKQILPDRPVMGAMFGKSESESMSEMINRRIEELGIADNVRLMGWRTPGPYWIGACNQLIIPAVGEPFGRTLVEAMLVGTPVVATRSGGNIEALRDGKIGVLVEPENAAALAEAIAMLAKKPDLAEEYSAKAREDALTRFGEDIHMRQVTETYDQMLAL